MKNNEITNEQLNKISELIGEVRPYFLAQIKKEKAKARNLKISLVAAVFLFAIISTTTIGFQFGLADTIVYHNINAQEMGFPTDEYGFITVY